MQRWTFSRKYTHNQNKQPKSASKNGHSKTMPPSPTKQSTANVSPIKPSPSKTN